MKCPYCGAETRESTCQYCGSQVVLPNAQTRTTSCAKCGSNNISFSRENQGEIRGKNTKQIVHRTVGYCKDCGNTWYIEGDMPVIRKRRTWLWVLGWIFIFPVPLTILLLRKKEMKPALKYGLIAAAWIVYLIIGFSGRSSNDNTTTAKTTPQKDIVATETTEKKSEDKKDAIDSKVSQPKDVVEEKDISAEVEVEPAVIEDDVPKEYRNALIKAEQYSKLMHMSKQGLYDQLTSEYGENFTEEAAQYAIDHLDADWNSNALEKAKDYNSTMHMSKQGLYDQLVSEYGEQFTPEEAQYAIDHIDADWKANALEKAKSYQDTMAMSTADIYDQLISEYGEQFTAEEAQYAIDHLED